MGKYILNQETQKLELHFTKEEYKSLDQNLKQEIKSNFLYSSKSNAWVSRTTNSHWRAEEVAKKLGLENGGKVGKRLSYAEELEVKTEKAEMRIEKFQEYSQNALNRMTNLQADFNKYRKDWSWLTQPIIQGHAGSKAFASHKNRVMARFEKGIEEYNKSEYYKSRIEIARKTANHLKLRDKVYLDKKIKECNKTLKAYQDWISSNEAKMFLIQQGKEYKNYGEIITIEKLESEIENILEKYEYENDKLNFFENCLNEIGGLTYNKDNIKKGDKVKIRNSWGTVLSVNPKTVRILNSLGWDWMKYPYSEIQELEKVEVKE